MSFRIVKSKKAHFVRGGHCVFPQSRRSGPPACTEPLTTTKDRPDVLVLGLPRGGVPVAYEIARELNVPLDVFIVRKLGVPHHEELAMGAIASGGVRVLNEGIIREFGISSSIVELVAAREEQEVERRERQYPGARPYPRIKDKIVIIADDGLATGSTMKAALAALRQQQPARLIVAVPTAPASTCEELKNIADEVMCGVTPEPFYAVGGSYANFQQTTDEEVRDLLEGRGLTSRRGTATKRHKRHKKVLVIFCVSCAFLWLFPF